MASLGERMVGAIRADVATFEEIERDPTALGQAVTVIVLAGVASLIGNIFRNGLTMGVMFLLATLIGYAIWTVLVVVIGTKLMPEPSTKAGFQEGFRVIGFAASPGVFNVLAIIPFLGPVISFFISIWMLVVMVIAVRSVLDYTSTGRAIVVCLIGMVVYWIINFAILMPLLVGRAILYG
ncbi:MAG TPA: YIP1 family protein [Vicinamibacterales bacterium]|nr:YIP1 family protein [Vicinamibacterales bacterium]